MKVLGLIDTEVDVVSKKYVDDKVNNVDRKITNEINNIKNSIYTGSLMEVVPLEFLSFVLPLSQNTSYYNEVYKKFGELVEQSNTISGGSFSEHYGYSSASFHNIDECIDFAESFRKIYIPHSTFARIVKSIHTIYDNIRQATNG